MSHILRIAITTLAAALLAACGKSADNAASDAPLAFVPADSPYVYANIDATPAAVTVQWSKKMESYWPSLFGMYDRMLGDAKHIDDRSRRVAAALVDELKTRNNWDKLREIGFTPDMHIALYGVGLVPVLRIELGDPEKFRATIARIEAKIGEKLPVAKAGNQEFWQMGNDKVAVLLAIEGKHLVATLAPTTASDALKQTLLGVVRPEKNILGAGTLQALAKQYNYTNYGVGFIDAVRITERLTTPGGSDQDFATALGTALPSTDATCRTEYLQIAHKFPRIVAGTEELTTQRLRVGAQFEIEPALAQQIATMLPAAPGTGAPGSGIVDFSVALPVLKFKDFWIKQADDVAAKPFACASLAQLNDGFRESKQKMDVTLPPPFSDLTGVRVTLTKLEWIDGSMIPDFAGKVLMGSTNPTVALAMAELALPALKDLKITPGAKPIAIPKEAIPGPMPPMFAAMSDKAIAIAAGANEDATLAAYLNAPAAPTPVFMRTYFTGSFYGVMARAMQKMKASLPTEQRERLEDQTKMFALYEHWLRSGEMLLTANAAGISFEEIVEMNPD
jgi:hypothetical protein